MSDEFPNPDYEETDGLDLDVLALRVFEEVSDDVDEILQPEILKRFDAFVEQLKKKPSIEKSAKLEIVLTNQLEKIATEVIEEVNSLGNLKKAYLTTCKQVGAGFNKALWGDISRRLFLYTKKLEEGMRAFRFSGTISEVFLEKTLKNELNKISQTVLVDTIIKKFEKILTPEAQVQFNQYIDRKIRPEINNGDVIKNLEVVLNKLGKIL